MIHQEDPDHPVTTMLAGINKREIEYLKTRCPELDLLSVQVYGGLAKVPQQLRTVATLYKCIRYIEKNKKQNQRKTKRNECLTHKI